MKVKRTNQQPEFQPIELKITIESEEEFKAIYSRFNILMSDIPEHVKQCLPDIEGISNTSKVFDLLYIIAMNRGYIK